MARLTVWRWFVSLAALSALGTTCGPQPVQPDGGNCELAVRWGNELDCDFKPFADGDKAEMTLGFQGFRYVESGVRVTGVPDGQARLTFDLDIEGQALLVQPAGTVPLRPGADGALYAHGVLVFLNDIPLAELVGRRAQVTLVATVGDCRAQDQVQVTLVDEIGGVQGLDAGYACPDAG